MVLFFFVSQSAYSFNSRLAGKKPQKVNAIRLYTCDRCNASSRDERDRLLPCPFPSSSCLKDICCENRGTCCASGLLQTVNSAALASGHRKAETGSVKLTGTHNLLKHLTPRSDDKRRMICRTKARLLYKLLLYELSNSYNMGKRRTYVRLLTSARISLMGLLGAAIKYGWRAQHTGKCISNFGTYFCKNK